MIAVYFNVAVPHDDFHSTKGMGDQAENGELVSVDQSQRRELPPNKQLRVWNKSGVIGSLLHSIDRSLEPKKVRLLPANPRVGGSAAHVQIG
jgi:hypothetical protein